MGTFQWDCLHHQCAMKLEVTGGVSSQGIFHISCSICFQISVDAAKCCSVAVPLVEGSAPITILRAVEIIDHVLKHARQSSAVMSEILLR